MDSYRGRFAVVALFLCPVVQAADSETPLFGNEPQAKVALECHANYARRYAKKVSSSIVATPTEVAIAASAHCVDSIDKFNRAVMASANDDPAFMANPDKYRSEKISRMRDYLHAYTIDVYLKSTAILFEGDT